MEDLSEFDFTKVQIGLFSPGGSVSSQFAPKAAASGCIVIDNTSFFRMEKNVPLIIPEVNADSLDEFFEEARVLAALNHPNVVSIYDITQWGDNPIIVMEYIDGVNLSLVLRVALTREESIPTPLSTHIIHEAAQGLAFAHAAKDPGPPKDPGSARFYEPIGVHHCGPREFWT